MKKIQRYNPDVFRLAREIHKANQALAYMDNDMATLTKQKEMNESLLEKVKWEYMNLKDEKSDVEKQLSIAKRSAKMQKIPQLWKECDQLAVEYEKLDHKQRILSKRIDLLEDDLAYIISKLEVSKKEKPVVPRLDLSKLNHHRVLPPIKKEPETPITPRKGASIVSAAQDNLIGHNTDVKSRARSAKPKMSRSSSVVMENKEFVKPAAAMVMNRQRVLPPINPQRGARNASIRQVRLVTDYNPTFICK